MFKIGDKVQIHDRKLKTHGFRGEILGIDETIEKTKIYTVQVVVLDKDNKPTKNKKVINALEGQLDRIIETLDEIVDRKKKKQGKKK